MDPLCQSQNLSLTRKLAATASLMHAQQALLNATHQQQPMSVRSS